MPSKKQIAWRKKFGKLAKSGAFKKAKAKSAKAKKTKSTPMKKRGHTANHPHIEWEK